MWRPRAARRWRWRVRIGRRRSAARLQALGVDVVEMSGRAGDVYLMDMRLLHTPSINATRQMRLMATTRCLFGP